MTSPYLYFAAACFVLAPVCYLASNVGAEKRNYQRHKGLMAAMGALLGVGLAASILAVVA